MQKRFYLGDGTTGQVRIEPTEGDLPRLRGAAGLAGIAPQYEANRHEYLAAMRAGEVGSIHSWELVTGVDGPGTRLTVFFSGCPLQCLYCHNPDTLHMRKGTAILAEDLLERILRYRTVFKVLGGGVTFLGGEALMQPAFLARLLAGCQEAGIHTCVDTSGYLGLNVNQEMMGNINLVLLDLKSGNEETYKRVTGRDLAPTLAFGDRLHAARVPVWIRFVLVPGLTDEVENIDQVAQIAAKWSNVERVEVLPFHKMGEDKWRELGLRYELSDTPPPTAEATEKARNIFRQYGLTVY